MKYFDYYINQWHENFFIYEKYNKVPHQVSRSNTDEIWRYVLLHYGNEPIPSLLAKLSVSRAKTIWSKPDAAKAMACLSSFENIANTHLISKSKIGLKADHFICARRILSEIKI